MPGDYRASAETSAEAEAVASARIAALAGRLRLVIYGPLVTAGVIAIVPVFFVAREVQLLTASVHFPIVSGAASAAVFSLSILLARTLTRIVMRARVPDLAKELSTELGVPVEDIALLAKIFVE